MATKVKTAEYELILMLDAAAPEEARTKLADDARSRIETAGELRHAESWGLRKLAYEIEQRGEADYRFFRFEAPAPSLEDLRHALSIADGVLRFRIFEVDSRAPLMTPPEITLAPSGRERDGRGRRRSEDEERGGDAAETTEPTAEAPAAPAEPAAEAPAEESVPPAAPAAETPPEPAAEEPEAAPEPAAEEPAAPAAEEPSAEEPAAPAAEPSAEEPQAPAAEPAADEEKGSDEPA